MKTHSFESLDELAAIFDEHAKHSENLSRNSPSKTSQEAYRAEATIWSAAARILRDSEIHGSTSAKAPK
jgi:hypothetical protein